MATGLIVKNLKRVKDEVDPKEQYLETFQRCHPDTAPGVRPNISGSVFTRKITETEWKEIPEDVKILKLDTRTTNRQMFIPPSQAALELSKRDRMTSRAAFIKDHNGDNPVAGGVYHKPETWLTVSQRPLIEAQEEQMKQIKQNLINKTKDAAVQLYGCTEEEGTAFAQKLSEPERRQLVFLASEAQRRIDNKWDQ